MRPCDSVTGTRCTRCTPPSYFRCAQTPSSGSDRAPGLDRQLRVLVAAQVRLGGTQQLRRPAHLLRVPRVHPQQVRGEQRRLLAALPRLDLEDHVARVVGVARDEDLAQPGRGRVGRLLQRRQLGGEALVDLRQLGGGLGVVGRGLPRRVRLRDPAELGVPTAELAGVRGVGVHRRVGQLGLDLRVLGEQRLGGGECLAHAGASFRWRELLRQRHSAGARADTAMEGSGPRRAPALRGC